MAPATDSPTGEPREISRRRSSYGDAAVGIGVVHLGLGAFHRAHQAAYLDAWLERNGGGPWGICAANLRANQALVDALTAQDCRYHLAVWRDRRHVELSEIRSIRRALFARDDQQALFRALSAPATRIVTLTVTEKAYGLKAASGELNTDDPAVAHDLREPEKPVSVPGVLVEALRRRRLAGVRPFTVLCCDNMPGNGRRTRIAVTELARLRRPELAAWIEDAVAFPSSMVDRIVPAVTTEARARLARLIGRDDPAAVATETFSQWVVEDRFSLGRPDWEAEGVEMVADVAPHETMKLRLLNGAHSLLSYAGLLRGFTTVDEAIADPALAAMIGEYWREAGASLGPRPPTDPATYTAQLLERFRNDVLGHSLRQIAMDGSQKLPQRWLAGALVNIEHGRPVGATAAAVAAWLAYVRGNDGRRASWSIDDPLAERLAACHRGTPGDSVAALLALTDVFPPSLALHPAFRRDVLAAYTALPDARGHA
jgi:fructuronate reductase